MPNVVKRHVLVIAYYFPPMGLSGVQRIAKLVKYLPENGWRITVLTPDTASYFAFDDGLLEELTANPDISIVRTSSLDPTRFGKSNKQKTVSFPEERSRRFLSSLSQWTLLPDNKIGWKRFAMKAARQIFKQDPFDLVYATAPPYTCLMIGAAIARREQLPLIVDYRDDWVDNPRHTYPTYWHRKLTARMEHKVLEECVHVFSINETIMRAIQLRNPQATCSYSVVPQGYDPADFDHIQDQNPQAGDPSVMTFLYAGMFYDAQQPDTFLTAVRVLHERRPELKRRIKLKFVGLFPESKKILIQQLSLENNTELMGYLDHSDATKQLAKADVAWMIIGHQTGEEMISTGKLFEYMGSQKPILALVPNGEAKRALEGYDAATLVDPDDVEAISVAIEELYDRWQSHSLPMASAEHVKQFDRKVQASIIASEFASKIS